MVGLVAPMRKLTGRVPEGRSRVSIAVIASRETFWNEFWSTFEDVQVEMHGFTEVGSEVVVPNTAHLQGRDEIEVIARSAFVYTVENGQITRLRMFQDEAEALEAAEVAGLAVGSRPHFRDSGTSGRGWSDAVGVRAQSSGQDGPHSWAQR